MSKFDFQRICDFDNLKNSYDNSIFLIFDIDWACDEVLNYCVDLLEKYEAKATFFVTHPTSVLDRIRENQNFELGIHPNFNFLLNGDHRYGSNFKEVINYYHEMVPDAVSVRSHSLTQSASIIDEFVVRGIKYDVNLLIMYLSEIELKPIPYYHNGFMRLPYFWEDDTYILYNREVGMETLLRNQGLKIFDFHPIHVFLNTSDLRQYDVARPFLKDYKRLKDFQIDADKGTRRFLEQLMNFAK